MQTDGTFQVNIGPFTLEKMRLPVITANIADDRCAVRLTMTVARARELHALLGDLITKYDECDEHEDAPPFTNLVPVGTTLGELQGRPKTLSTLDARPVYFCPTCGSPAVVQGYDVQHGQFFPEDYWPCLACGWLGNEETTVVPNAD